MKAAVVQSAGTNPVYGDFFDPEPRDGAQLVAVRAAAISQLAKARASGSHYSSQGQFPLVAGVDGVGALSDGRRVYFLTLKAPFGSMAERSLVREDSYVPVPDQVDDAVAAAIANPGMSSWAAFSYRARLKAGEAVLINGATGSSGRMAVQIARHLGASRIVVSGRNPAALEALKLLGADETVLLDGDEDALETAFKPHFADGIEVVLDYLWGRSARSLLVAAAKASEAAKPMRFVQIGSMSGQEISLPAAILRSSAIEMMGSGLGSIPMENLLEAVSGVFRAAVSDGLTTSIRTVPLSEVADVWDDGDTSRRIVLTV